MTKVARGNFLRAIFIYVSSDEDAMPAGAFENHRDNPRDSQSVLLMIGEKECCF